MTEAPEPGAPSRSRLPWPITAVVAVLAVTALVIVLLGHDRRPTGKTWDRPLEPVAMANELRGSVKVVRGDDRRDLARGQTIYIGEIIETGSGSSASLTTYPVDTFIELGADSRLLLESPGEVRLQSGRLNAEVHEAATRFLTAHGRVLGQGSSLSLDVRAEGTEVKVGKGGALVDGPGGNRMLEPGGRAFLSAPPAGAER